MMQTLIRRRNVVSKTRVAWAREGGARRRCTHARMQMALVARFRAGWIPVIPPGRSPYERVTVLRRGHALAGVARAYLAGQHSFDRQEIEAALRQPLATRAGAAALAAVGFALLRLDAARLELRAADPRAAHLINRARLGTQHRGYRVRRVLEAFLSLSPGKKRRSAVTDDRRLEVARRLHDDWMIDGYDLLNCRPFARLQSDWIL